VICIPHYFEMLSLFVPARHSPEFVLQAILTLLRTGFAAAALASRQLGGLIMPASGHAWHA
jgi:hypothetical protein